MFEKGNYTEQDRLEYNSNMKQVYEDSMNFVVPHYFNNPVKVSSWEHVDKNSHATDSPFDLPKGYKQSAQNRRTAPETQNYLQK